MNTTTAHHSGQHGQDIVSAIDPSMPHDSMAVHAESSNTATQLEDGRDAQHHVDFYHSHGAQSNAATGAGLGGNYAPLTHDLMAQNHVEATKNNPLAVGPAPEVCSYP